MIEEKPNGVSQTFYCSTDLIHKVCMFAGYWQKLEAVDGQQSSAGGWHTRLAGRWFDGALSGIWRPDTFHVVQQGFGWILGAARIGTVVNVIGRFGTTHCQRVIHVLIII